MTGGQKTALILAGTLPVLALLLYLILEEPLRENEPGQSGLPVFLRILAAGQDGKTRNPAVAASTTNRGTSSGTPATAATSTGKPASDRTSTEKRAASVSPAATNLGAFLPRKVEDAPLGQVPLAGAPTPAAAATAFCRALLTGSGPTLARLADAPLSILSPPFSGRLDPAELLRLDPSRIWLRRPLEGHLHLADFRARARLFLSLPVRLTNNVTLSNASGLRLGLALKSDGRWRVRSLIYDNIHPLLLGD